MPFTLIIYRFEPSIPQNQFLASESLPHSINPDNPKVIIESPGVTFIFSIDFWAAITRSLILALSALFLTVLTNGVTKVSLLGPRQFTVSISSPLASVFWQACLKWGTQNGTSPFLARASGNGLLVSLYAVTYLPLLLNSSCPFKSRTFSVRKLIRSPSHAPTQSEWYAFQYR